MQVRFVILITGKTSELIVRLARRTARFSRHYFTVNGKRLHPHITLFDLNVRRQNLQSLLAALNGVLKKQKTFGLRINGFWGRKGFIVLNIPPSGSLLSLRQRLYKDLKIVSTRRPPGLNKIFRPHITLARFKSLAAMKKFFLNQPRVRLSFNPEKIALVQVNKHGQVKKIIKEFKIK